MRRTTTRAFAVATASLTLLACSVTTAAIAASDPLSQPDGTSAYEPAMLDAMRRDLGMERERAVDRLQFQADAAETQTALAKQLGAEFGGAWVDPAADVLYVAVTDAAGAAAAKSAGATPVTVSRALDTLEAYVGRLDAHLADVAAVPSWYADVPTNSVVVNVAQGGLGKAKQAVRAAGVPADAVTFTVSKEKPTTLIDVVGGNAYSIGTSRCSVGFSATGGFVTAGHCGRVGSTTSSPSGQFTVSSFPGNDYAYVRVNSGNTLIGAVNNYAGGRVSVAGSTAVGVGASVCRSGSTTGWHCGSVTALNSSVTYSQGTVSGLIRTNVCAEPGDSGGSLIAGSQAQGLTSGGSGNCSSGGTTYFQPVNEALSAAGVSLILGGGTTPPPTGTCTGFANNYTGSLSSGATAVVPNGSYYTVSRSGTVRGCLDGPSGTDFDLHLQKWSGSAWATVAQGITSSPDESVSYSGTSGYYRFVVQAYSGSGSYAVGVTLP
ncbi:S1 family peptidase [Antribacter gilvus]|uniref:S1 family peptidase n=1 Tax=Antribacter gilvus TaxID=2304675 RepID=UPI000F76BF08|nr:S1 family peptidase [Antribacter gilvus]